MQEASPLVSLVAEAGARVVGHVLCSPVSVGEEPRNETSGGLGPVGVLPDAQGEGVGAALIRAALAASRGLGWRLLFVLGDPAYYARFGFILAAPHGLHYESHAFDAAFQVQELVPGALIGRTGRVRYHAAFDGVR